MYYGTGRDWTIIYNDFWKYNPLTDAWEQLSDIPKQRCYETVSLSIYDKGYLGLGRDCTGVFLNDFWEYRPISDQWEQLEDSPSDGRYYAKAVSFAGYGIVGSGQNEFSEMLNDFYAYQPIAKTCTKLPDPPMINRRGMSSAAIPFHGAFFIGGLDETFTRSNQVFQIKFKDDTEASFKLIYNDTQRTLYISQIDSVSQINVFNINGRAVYDVRVSDSQHFIQTLNWNSGAYLVRINQKVKKIVIL